MPLYEMIAITKAQEIKSTKQLMRNMANFIWDQGGLLRDVNVLGDRILARSIKSNDNKSNLVGRYLQLIFDGSPEIKDNVQIFAKRSNLILFNNIFRMKDFYNEAQTYKKIAAHQSPIVTLKERNEEYLKEIEKALKHKEKNIFDNIHY